MYNKLQQLLLNVFERLTGYLAVIQSDHAYIHRGWAFTYSGIYDLAGEAVKSCYLVIPDSATSGKDVHFRPLIFSSTNSAIKVEFFEAGTYADGTETASFNRNRQSTNVSTVQVFDGSPTITADGDRLLVGVIGSGGQPSRVSGGSGAGAEEEILLKSDTKYLVKCTNLTTTATTVSTAIFWYEEDAYNG